MEDGKTDRIVIRDPAEGCRYMEISQDADKLLGTAAGLEAELRKDFSRVEAHKCFRAFGSGFHPCNKRGTKADDPIVDYYLISNKKGDTLSSR